MAELMIISSANGVTGRALLGPDSRRKFLALDDQDLRAITTALPPLVPAWARRAKVPLPGLQAGSDRAIRGLRAAAARDAAFFIQTLVDFALSLYLPAAVDDLDDSERALEMCRALLAATSRPVVEVFIAALVEGGHGEAAALTTLGDTVFNLPAAVGAERAADVEGHASISHERDENRPQATEGDATTVAQGLEELRSRQTSLAEQLRDAADKVQRGMLAEDVRRSFDDWSTQVQHQLEVVAGWGPATNVDEALTTVHQVIERAADARSHLEGTLAAVQALLSASMTEAAMDLLHARGFDDLESLHAAATEHGLDWAVPAPEADTQPGDRLQTPGALPRGVSPGEGSHPDQNMPNSATGEDLDYLGPPPSGGCDGRRDEAVEGQESTVDHALADNTAAGSSPPTASRDEKVDRADGPEPNPVETLESPTSASPRGEALGDVRLASEQPTGEILPSGADETAEEVGAPELAPAMEPSSTAVDGPAAGGPEPDDVPSPTWTPGSAAEHAELALHEPLLPVPSLQPSDSRSATAVSGRSPIAQLISGGDHALAMSAASTTEPTERQDLLRWWAGASLLTRPGLERTLPHLALEDATLANLGADDSRLALAAGLKSALRLGYPPVSLRSLAGQSDLPQPTAEAFAELTDVAVRGFRREDGNEDGPGDTLDRLRLLGDNAQQTLVGLRHRQIKLARASQIIRYACRDGQIVSEGLTAVIHATGQGGRPSGAGSTEVEAVRRLARLTDEDERARLIDDIDKRVSSKAQLTHKLEAGALAKLHQDLADAGEIAGDFLVLQGEINSQSSAADLETRGRLLAAAHSARDQLHSDTPGSAALAELLGWLQSDTVPYQHETMESLQAEAVRLAWSVPRDDQQRPVRALSPAEIEYLLNQATRADAVAGFAAVGNLDAARELTLELPPGAAHSDIDDLVATARGLAQRRHESLLDRLDRECWRLRALQQDELARQVGAESELLRDPATGRWDLVLPALETLIDRCDQQLLLDRESLLARTRALSCSTDELERIEQQIQAGDEPLALEFITAAEAGQPLPSTAAVQAVDYLEFFPNLVDFAAEAAGSALPERLRGIRSRLGADEVPGDRQLAEGLQAWTTLKGELRNRDRFRSALAQVLRMLGLVPGSQGWLREHGRATRAGFSTFKVKAQPIGRSYVPSLGTQALGEYLLLIAWDPVASPGRLLDFVDESDRTRPVVILYCGVLTTAQRIELRNQTLSGGGKGFSPLVVDDVVIGWLSTRGEPGWRLTQRVTLPFSSINPYTPFAAGEVPDEVFVGRNEERRRIEDPTGSMFLYGGRQLGKSALLRRVERLTNQHRAGSGDEAPQGPVAIYLDLKAAQIGEALEPAALWGALAERLRESGIATRKLGRQAGAREVRTVVREWLERDESNRLLLLLDEADNFLTSDSGIGDTSERRAEFPTLGALKELLESTNRRFKPVFAGLHQVQRFHDSANTPVAHGGQDILIGPLKPQDAYQLVEEPLTALGYRFESPELVWRLLLFTNYQASLVQIVCEALVRHMSRRRISPEAPQILVTRADVESVHADRDVRELIAQRFRWTINLDPRYRLIALVVALRSLDAQPGETFDERDLREECETWWPLGFQAMSDGEFRRYLVEMVGLGVLHQQGARFGLRSPHIVGMLGSRESLNRELDEANRLLELPQEYNAAMHRSPLDGLGTLDAPRSPLTDAELAQFLHADPSGEDGGLRVVIGSEALGLPHLPAALSEAALRLGSPTLERITARDAERLPELVRRRAHVLVDLTGEIDDDPDLSEVVGVLRRAARLTGTVAVGPGSLGLLPALAGLPTVRLSKWSAEGLQAWRESPFTGPDMRRRLVRVTGGWPSLVERIMSYCAAGVGTDEAMTRLVQELADPAEAAAFLSSTGMDLSSAIGWGRWLTTTADADGLVESLPAALHDIETALESPASELLDQLALLDIVRQTDEGWVLDRVVAAAGSAIAEQG